MPERWFTDEELDEMSRPTMDVAIEAIDRGDTDEAKQLCEGMKHESQFMHDLLVDGMAGLISFVKEKLGDEGVEEAWECSLERSWKQSVETIDAADRQDDRAGAGGDLARPFDQRGRPQPGRLRDHRGRREAHLHDEPLRLRPAALAQRPLRADGWGVTDEAHDWSYGRKGFPLYCTHCAFMNELLPIRWIGYPVYPSEPPEDFDRDPCIWYWYKDPADIPERHWERYGLERSAGG